MENNFKDINITNSLIVDYCKKKKYDILIYCCNNKIVVPQAALYLCFLAKNIDMINICINGGSVVDKYCMAISIKLMDIELIKYHI